MTLPQRLPSPEESAGPDRHEYNPPTYGQQTQNDHHRPAEDFIELDELRVSFWGVSRESLQNFYDN